MLVVDTTSVGEVGLYLDNQDPSLARQNQGDYIDSFNVYVREALVGAAKTEGFKPESILWIGIITIGSTPVGMSPEFVNTYVFVMERSYFKLKSYFHIITTKDMCGHILIKLVEHKVSMFSQTCAFGASVLGVIQLYMQLYDGFGAENKSIDFGNIMKDLVNISKRVISA